jgi:hypothetical protein
VNGTPAKWFDVLLRACIVPASALGRAAEPNLGSLSWQATNDRRPTPFVYNLPRRPCFI